jgi:excisionase family DNA binding protein
MQQIFLQGLGLKDLKNLISEVLEEKLCNTQTKDSFITDSKYLSRKEVALLLKISFTTLNDWSKRGLIQSYRIGNRILYKKNEIEQAITQVKNLKYKRG